MPTVIREGPESITVATIDAEILSLWAQYRAWFDTGTVPGEGPVVCLTRIDDLLDARLMKTRGAGCS